MKIAKVTLRISTRDKVNASRMCADVVDLLVKLGIQSTVHPTISSVKYDNSVREAGVSVDLYNVEKSVIVSNLWPLLKDSYSLECAHVLTEGFSGCYFDWIRESSCPFKIREKTSHGSSSQESCLSFLIKIFRKVV